MTPDRLLSLHERVAEAPDAVARLRRLVLDLAVRGNLVEQDPKDEPASELLKRIAAEKARLPKAGSTGRSSSFMSVTVEEIPFPVPTNWAWCHLGSLILSADAGWSPRTENHPRKGDTWAILKVSAVSWGEFKPQENKQVLPGTQPRLQAQVHSGDFLISRANTAELVARAALVFEEPCKLMMSDKIVRLRLSANCDHRFICMTNNYAGYARTYYAEKATGVSSSMKNVSRDVILRLPVPLPPLAEQRRIVAKVDEMMGLLDRLEEVRERREATRDRLTAATFARLSAPETTAEAFPGHARFALDTLPALTARPNQIKPLRQTILNLAVRGKLVEQDPNDEPASELLRRIAAEKARAGVKHSVSPLREDEISFELPAGWNWTRIGEICSKTGSGSTPRGGRDVYKKSGIPLLRSQNVFNEGPNLNDVAFIDPQTHKRMKGTRVLPGDLLLNITGGSMGRCSRVPENFGDANVSQHVAIIRLAVSGMDRFLHALILSPYFQAFIFDEQTGAGRGGLPKNRMDKIAVGLPPLAEQHRIMAKVDELMLLCDRMEASLAGTATARARLLEACLYEALPFAAKAELQAAE